MESLSGKPCNDCAAQTVLDSKLLFPAFCGVYPPGNSSVIHWSLLVMIPDILSQEIYNLCFIKENESIKGIPYSVGNLGKQPIFISIFFKMAGGFLRKTLFAS